MQHFQLVTPLRVFHKSNIIFAAHESIAQIQPEHTGHEFFCEESSCFSTPRGAEVSAFAIRPSRRVGTQRKAQIKKLPI